MKRKKKSPAKYLLKFIYYLVPEPKTWNTVFQFCLEISSSLRLLSFFNSKLKTKNSKPCLNVVFVQALFRAISIRDSIEDLNI